MELACSPNGHCELMPHLPIRAGALTRLDFKYYPEGPRPSGMHLWLFMDIRQAPGVPQAEKPGANNYISASTTSGEPVHCHTFLARTLDLYPALPEFLYVCELSLNQGLPDGQGILFTLGHPPGMWQAPLHPIREFHFWFLDSGQEPLEFTPTGYKSYYVFNTANPENLHTRLAVVSVSIEGELPSPVSNPPRPTPGILWGDLHGMAFNQRPLDDYFRYARDVTHLDFAAALLFSYNTCTGEVWQAVKDAAMRWTEAGRFLAIAGFEAGTLPDGSHRNAYFFEPSIVPPIFCEDRPPALDPRLLRRFHPDTIICTGLEAYYQAVARFGGFVTGHFHTWNYQKEVLAEIWQKQVGPEGDESRIFDLLNRGYRFGIVGGSDTHDSMPGNQQPEPYCPQPAGMMAVFAEQVTREAIQDSILRRQVYATSGARIGMRFFSGEFPMGSVLHVEAERNFFIQVEGAAPLKNVELLCNGQVVWRTEPAETVLQADLKDRQVLDGKAAWYLLRVLQEDGHRAWSSPIWFDDKEQANLRIDP